MKGLLIIMLLLWPPCEEEPDPSGAFDESVILAYGASTRVGPGSLEIGFDRVINESRCGLEMFCIWAGRATIGLWLYGPAPDTVRLEIGIGGYVFMEDTLAHEHGDTLDYSLTLMQLDPYPSIDRGQSQHADYVAHLQIAKL